MDSFNLPFYTPYSEEVREIVEKQRSFNLEKIEVFEVNWDPNDDVSNKKFVFNKDKSGQSVASCIRAVTEPILASHFGQGVIDTLFRSYAKHVAEHLALEKTKFINLVVSITKK